MSKREITGRITGSVFSWSAGGYSFLLKTEKGNIPIIVEDNALFRKCKKGVNLVISGESNGVEGYGQHAGAAIVAAEVRRS
jgi:hypothetical protein